MTTALAVWGAVLATVSLGWQIFREWSRSQPKITVSIEGSADVRQAAVKNVDDNRPALLDYWITVEVVNEGEHIEYLRELDIEEPGAEELPADGESFKCGYTLVDRTGNDEQIPARGRLNKMIEASELRGFDLTNGIIVRAVLASGLVVKSSLEKFDLEIVDHVRYWNQSRKPDQRPREWLEHFPP